MSIQEKPISFSKVKRSAEQMNIHNFFIFNKAGICLFSRNYTKRYNIEENLISSFFTALMSFAKEIIGNKVKTIEMNGIKFVILEKDAFYYGFLCNSIENLLLLEDIINKTSIEFALYVNKNKVNTSSEYVYDEELNQIIDAIIKQHLSNEFDVRKEDKIVEHLKEMTLNKDIFGLILLTDKGKVIYTSLETLDLKELLKEVDFRVKICNNSILKLFYTSKKNELIFSENVNDLYFVILIFDVNTKFGIAEYYLRKAVSFIDKTLKS